MLAEGEWPLIIGQWGLHFSAADMRHQHDVSADIGIASRVIASATPTILNRHVILLRRILLTAALRSCDANHSRLSSGSQDRPISGLKVVQQRQIDLRNTIAKDVRTSWLNANTAYDRLDVTSQLLKQSGIASEK